LIEHEAVEHQPGDPVDQNELSRRRIATEVLNQTVPGGRKKPALFAAIIDRTSTQCARERAQHWRHSFS
jgi:hypothetical protein